METFDAGWLALREPVDHRSRAAALLPLLEVAWRAHGWSRILDLGSGTGSNLRYLAPRLPGAREWTLVDHDAELLARVNVPTDLRRLVRVCGNLADEGLASVGRAHLVTGSALLDLVSEAWLHRLAEACRAAACGVLFALTYDGTIAWSSNLDDDEPDDNADEVLVRQAVNTHQQGDKGLGPALGPRAGPAAEQSFQRSGYRTWLVPSPWRLGPADAELALALVDGWQDAALDVERHPDAARRIHAWARRRRQAIASGAFRLTVGHVDLLALPDTLA